MRLPAAIWCDFRVQWRNGFYVASAFVVATTIIILRLLPDDVVGYLLPAFIFQNIVVNAFYFAAGQVLLENGEGTRAAQLVTPLRRGEYLVAKAVSLGFLSLVESLIISVALQGLGPGLIPLTVGVALASFLLTLLGVALVCPYPSINEFIMPSVLFTILLGIPMLGWFAGGPTWPYDWHPLQGPLHLIGTRHTALGTERLVVMIALPLVWCVPIYFWSRRALRRNVMA